MAYIDGFMAPVRADDRDTYVAWLKDQHAIFKEYGADVVVDAWEDDVPKGDVTSMRKAVALEDGERVALGWIMWPDKSTRDAAWAKVMEDPRMSQDSAPMPFDGKRMIFGGFAPVLITD
ncbi:DUF1428 domain-containing protein [uncultured Tateyamaria sp.]|uniref:DUF1428 domain-containing protein n=1 Tax=uncultured Tateyamaria sp. TaxID=455651 RepID=UPI00261B08BA|nr:DUF1428 domain-containing protein [uncultured Tateyamaria sp.]